MLATLMFEVSRPGALKDAGPQAGIAVARLPEKPFSKVDIMFGLKQQRGATKVTSLSAGRATGAERIG
jgi:hypothetical protein